LQQKQGNFLEIAVIDYYQIIRRYVDFKFFFRLTQERGLWGPFNESPLTKWSLDMTEGPSRYFKSLLIVLIWLKLNNILECARGWYETIYFIGIILFAMKKLKVKLTNRISTKDQQATTASFGFKSTGKKKNNFVKIKYSNENLSFRSLAMFEREHNFVAMEYDDCDVSVAQPQTIDDHMRSIGFQGLKNVIGQATTLNSDTAEDDLESGIETGNSNETR